MEKRILVIDDERDICVLLHRRLTEAGYQVETAVSGKAGLETARRFQPHLMLLDIHMPQIDGFAVARTSKTDPLLRDIPIIIFTGEPVLGLPEKAKESGAADYLTKPFDPKELLHKIERVLGPEMEDDSMVEFVRP